MVWAACERPKVQAKASVSQSAKELSSLVPQNWLLLETGFSPHLSIKCVTLNWVIGCQLNNYLIISYELNKMLWNARKIIRIITVLN